MLVGKPLQKVQHLSVGRTYTQEGRGGAEALGPLRTAGRWNGRAGCVNGNRKQHSSRNKLFEIIVRGSLWGFEWQAQESKLIL